MLVVTPIAAGPEKVAFPAGYRSHVLYATVDRPDNKTVRYVYAPLPVVRAATSGQPLPNGTVLTMEVYRLRMDSNDQPVRGSDGRLVKGDLVGIFVMEKRTGWGLEYPEEIRNGEWEYARFGANGKRQPVDTKPCFECHKPVGGLDFVFTLPQLLATPK
ncbi:MAG: cytochrome P460 family protein [Candidatus Rokuibacteriota bacterium]